MTNTITYHGRTFTLDEDYEHPKWGRVRFVAFKIRDRGYFRNEDGHTLVLRYDSFTPPEPPRHDGGRVNTITYDGRTFTLDEDYEHPKFGTMRFVGLCIDRYGYFRVGTGNGFLLGYDSFPPPEPETVVVKMPMRNPGKEPFASFTFTFTHDEARAAIKALQDALPGDSDGI